MEVDAKQLIARNLRAAREEAGMSQDDFAAALGISRATLSAIENGHVAIDSTKLLKAAHVLGRPVSDFFREHVEELVLRYRTAEHVTPRPEVRHQFQNLCESFRELEEIVGVADTVLPPPEYKFLHVFHSKPRLFAAQVAKSERDRLGLGQRDPIENIFKVLDENGVRLFPIETPQEDVFGLSAFSQRYGPCILVNLYEHTVERDIFTVAHEYGHLLMHRDTYINRDPVPQTENEWEEMANGFAGHFLVPDLGLNEMLLKVGANRAKKIAIEDVMFLKMHFRVSSKMMLRRFKDAGVITPELHDDLWAKVLTSMGNNEKKEPAPLNVALIRDWKKVCRFQHLARKATLEGMVSVGKVAELLGKNVVEMRGLVREWRSEYSLVPA